MYIPSAFRVSDESTVRSFVEQYDFATVITSSIDDGLFVTHLPVLLRRQNETLILQGHVARDNEHWRCFNGSTQALAIFNGPHAYVSPTWYKTGPAVPTWNYAVVHLHGRPLATEDRVLTTTILETLVQKYEGRRAKPYRPEDLPADFYERMVQRVVAFEMPVERIEAKFKLGQNRSKEDREASIEGLVAEGSPAAAALAAFMKGHAGIS